VSESASLKNRRILLIIGGGIAAYKCLELIRRLKDRGATVRAILTEAGAQFVTPLSVGTLSGEPVFQSLFDLTREAEIGHIELSRDADLLVVAPATADLMAKMAQGLAGDLATTTLLATDKPVLIAPAMNVRMWTHRATQRNLEQLMADGVEIVGPNEGPMACNEFGPGRMAEPAEIIAAIEQHFSENAFSGNPPLKGIRALVTSGPTHEPIDPVRYIANRSSGKQGYAIATALARLGAETVLVSGPTNLPDPPGVTVKRVETAREMLAACEASLPVDVAVCAAAVADWRADIDATQKIKKEPGKSAPDLKLIENPDVLATISRLATNRPRLVVGFAAETEKVIEHAVVKRKRKGCDWIVANDVSPETGVMGGELNTVHLITGEGQEDWPLLSKQAVAERLARRILAHFTKEPRA
jgi:phosphopantothenoylcysteine decarboxylase/phosphopantothenate--cysteine ligase